LSIRIGKRGTRNGQCHDEYDARDEAAAPIPFVSIHRRSLEAASASPERYAKTNQLN